MPIRPSERHKYPPRAEWRALREACLKRGGGACECTGECGSVHEPCCRRHAGQFIGGVCGARNGAAIVRHVEHPERWAAHDCSTISQDCDDDFGEHGRRVVLTTAHLDHDAGNNVIGNLKAMCQRCHLRLDRHQHTHNARATRRSRRAVGELPGVEQ